MNVLSYYFLCLLPLVLLWEKEAARPLEQACSTGRRGWPWGGGVVSLFNLTSVQGAQGSGETLLLGVYVRVLLALE